MTMNEIPTHPTDEGAREDLLSRVPTRDIGPHPIVDGNRHAHITFHPTHEDQMDPGGATLTLDVPADWSDVADHPLVLCLLQAGWTLRSLVQPLGDSSHWLLNPPGDDQ